MSFESGERPPVLVAVVSTDGARLVARTVDGIAPHLKRPDEILILARDIAGVKRALGPTSRVEVVEHPGHDLGRVLAARAAGRALVCVEDHVMVPDRRTVEVLLAALAGGATVAVPASNAVSWPECPGDVPDLAATRDEIRATARRCTEEGDREPRPVSRVDGPFVAIAAGAVPALDRPLVDHTPATLAEAACAGGGRAVVCGSTYVHATKRLPLLSAALIMKDEEDLIADCLASLEPLVDEVVIYDTGSTDGSVELARRLGATVIEGHWDDNFARARNEALAYCRGDWVLSIDCDEQIEDPDRVGPVLRKVLVEQPEELFDVVALHLHNLEGSAISPVRNPQSNLVSRLFRRRRVMWSGALHEQPTARPGQPPIQATIAEFPRFLHSGYLAEVIEHRDKRERNLRISMKGLDGTQDEGKAHFDIARSMTLLNQHEEAIAEFELAAQSSHPVFSRCALELGITSLLELGRLSAAWEWLERYRAVSPFPGLVGWLEGTLHLAGRDGAAALVSLEGIADYNDRFSNNTADRLHLMRAQAHQMQGDLRKATEEAVEAIRELPVAGGAWHYLAAQSSDHPDLLATAAALVPEDRMMGVLAQLFPVGPDEADRVCEALWAVHPGNAHVLAFATDLAPKLALPRMLTWIVRFAEAGILDGGVLDRIASDEERSAVDRALALALQIDLLADEGRRAPLATLVERAPDAELGGIIDEVLRYAIAAADEVIVAGAVTPGRSAILADRLRAAGFDEQAEAVAAHGRSLPV